MIGIGRSEQPINRYRTDVATARGVERLCSQRLCIETHGPVVPFRIRVGHLQRGRIVRRDEYMRDAGWAVIPPQRLRPDRAY